MLGGGNSIFVYHQKYMWLILFLVNSICQLGMCIHYLQSSFPKYFCTFNQKDY